MTSYVCPHCGAYDSSTCKFRIGKDIKRGTYGRVVDSQQAEARKVGCRVQHYTDKFARTGSYDDKPN